MTIPNVLTGKALIKNNSISKIVPSVKYISGNTSKSKDNSNSTIQLNPNATNIINVNHYDKNIKINAFYRQKKNSSFHLDFPNSTSNCNIQNIHSHKNIFNLQKNNLNVEGKEKSKPFSITKIKAAGGALLKKESSLTNLNKENMDSNLDYYTENLHSQGSTYEAKMNSFGNILLLY
jgi:hypothetical protein